MTSTAPKAQRFVSQWGEDMERNFILQARAVATLVLINHAIYDIVDDQELDPDILEELGELQPQLQEIIDDLKEESPLHCPSTKSAM